MEDSELNFDMMMRSGVSATNLMVAGVGPTHLRARGVKSAQQLRLLGFDALHLCDADFCNEASMAFGSGEVRAAFLTTATDAVAIAGMEAMHILGVTVEQLLRVCAGYPGEAVAVLQQLPRGASLHDVPCEVVLDAGLRAETLKVCGYGLATVVEQLAPTGNQLVKLGFTC